MKSRQKSKYQPSNDEPGRSVPLKGRTNATQEAQSDRTMKTTGNTEKQYGSRSYYSRNGSYSGYKGL